jgi:putative sugar O-methyltransferase
MTTGGDPGRDRDFARPSRFWERLGKEHASDLAMRGPEWVKRSQALRYFTWRWRWPQAIRGEQFGFLLSHTSPVTWLRCLASLVDLSARSWEGIDWSWPERWAYSVAVRLLWEFARRHDSTKALELPEPIIGRPLPVHWRGRLISQDLANSALEAAAIHRAVGSSRAESLLEIGAGYGRTAYVLMNVFQKSTYTVVDVEPALSIARWYLTQLFPLERLRFLRPDEALLLPAGSVDIALSISSLQEMTPAQVEAYIELLDRVAAGGIVYLKQWAEWQNPDDGVTLRFADYPIPANWTETFSEPAPVQTSFRQTAWRVPASDPQAASPRDSQPTIS